LFFIPLYPKFPLFSVSGTYVSIRLEDLFVALTVMIFGIKLILNKDDSIFKWNLTKIILIYFGIGLLSVMSGIFITKNIVPHIALLHFARRVEYVSLLFVAYYSIQNVKQLKTYAWVIWIAVLGVIFYGLGQKFFGWPVVSTMNKEFSKGMILKLTWWARINSTFAGHYDLAAFLVMILCLSISVMRIVKRLWQKIPVFILLALSYYVLILTASRISFVAYLFGGLLILLSSRKKWWIAPFLIFSLLGMVFSEDLGQRYAATFHLDLSFLSGMVKVKEEKIAMVLPSPTPTIVPITSLSIIPKPLKKPLLTLMPTPTPTIEVATPSAEYFEPIELAVGRSTDIRLKVEWPRAVRAFLKNPLLGTGYSSITLATDNDYLRILGETGILGTAVFALIILEIFRRMFFFLKEKGSWNNEKILVLGILGAGAGYFINAGFIDVWESSKIAFFFWIMMGVGLKIIDLDRNTDN